MDDEPERVTYQFTIEREVWNNWRDTISHSTALYERLAELIEQDARARERDRNEETAHYCFRIDRETWAAWKDIVPQSATLHEQLTKLLDEDIDAAETEDWPTMEQKTAQLLANRIKHRSRTAEQAVGEDDEKVVEELQEIRDIAETIDE